MLHQERQLYRGHPSCCHQSNLLLRLRAHLAVLVRPQLLGWGQSGQHSVGWAGHMEPVGAGRCVGTDLADMHLAEGTAGRVVHLDIVVRIGLAAGMDRKARGAGSGRAENRLARAVHKTADIAAGCSLAVDRSLAAVVVGIVVVAGSPAAGSFVGIDHEAVGSPVRGLASRTAGEGTGCTAGRIGCKDQTLWRVWWW